jgi:hypothetical protein
MVRPYLRLLVGMSVYEWITFTVVEALARRALPAASRITDSNAAKRTIKHYGRGTSLSVALQNIGMRCTTILTRTERGMSMTR